MKLHPLVLAMAAAGFAATPQVSRAELLLYYNFESATATNNSVIDNIIAGKPDGLLRFGAAGGTVAFTLGGTVSGGNLGRTLQLTPAADGSGNLDAPNIDTAFTALAIGVTAGTPYTAMAWVNFGSASGDNMIFGQNGSVAANGGAVLHLGSRNGNYQSGHWGDDVGPEATPPTTLPTGTGAWHHVAYTNDAAGTQTFVVDGVQIGSGGTGTAGQMDNTIDVLIGTSNNGGSFSGQLDEIKIYNEKLTVAQIQQASLVPEPGTVSLLALGAGALGLLARRRRA